MRISSESEREHDPDACGSSESDTWGFGDNPPLGWIGDILREQPSLPSGARVGKYQLRGALGRGGVGTVYRARHIDDPTREVALKLFEPSWRLSQAQLALGHFSNRELRIASQVDHPHLVRILDSGMTAQGLVYLIMPLIDGVSLDTYVIRSEIGYRELANLLAQVCDALSYLHARGIVHRDLKPANILVTRDGHPYVTDLGVAWQEVPGVPRTVTGCVMGTPGYLSPEQLNPDVGRVSCRTDVYGLGATLYAVLVGRPPFDRGHSVSSILDVLLTAPLAPRRLNRSIPRNLERICLASLEKRPEDRYASAEALGEDLRRFATNRSVIGRPRTAFQRARRWVGAHRGRAAMLAAGVLVLAASVSSAIVSWRYSEGMRVRAASHLDLARQAVAEASVVLPQELAESPHTLKHQRTLLERGRDGFQLLLEQDPRNVELRRQAAVNLFLLAKVEYVQGDIVESVRTYRSALQLFQALAREFPDQDRWQFDCYHCYYGLYASYLSLGDTDRIDGCVSEMERLIETLVRRAPENTDYVDALANSLVLQSAQAREHGELNVAETYAHRARSWARKLEPFVDQEPLYIRHQATSALSLAKIRALQGDLPGALQWHDEAIHHARRMFECRPDNFRYELEWIGTVYERILTLAANGKRDRALREVSPIQDRVDVLAELHPDDLHVAGVAASVNQLVAELSADPAESLDTQVVESGRMQEPD
jgi:tetratricopeptide (TPR) repeat protein